MSEQFRNAVSAERHDSVLVVRFAHGSGNFLTDAMMAELSRLVADAERDPLVRAVVLASAVPGVFIGHYDVDELLAGSQRGGVPLPARLAGIPVRAVDLLGRIPALGRLLDHSPAAGVRALLRFREAVSRIRTSDLLFVAAIDGFALGGGFELALACDLRVIGEGSYGIGLPEITFDLLPAGGGTQMLARLVGTGAAIEAVLGGRLFSPDEALRAGVVQRKVKQEEVLDVALGLAERLSRRGPGAVRASKRVVYDGAAGRLERGMALERNEFLGLATRAPAQATVRAYAAELKSHLARGRSPVEFFQERLPDWREPATSAPARTDPAVTRS